MSQQISTEKRQSPQQSRSAKTVNQILNAAAALLEVGGFDKLTTNAICKQAGLTPPALYRYFPNKYAVMKELGTRLMQAQNAAMLDWLEITLEPENLAGQLADLLHTTLEITRTYQAGAWITRSLHASPMLADVRLTSHRQMAEELTTAALTRWPHLNRATAYQHFRLNIEISYAVLEMLLDDETADEASVIQNTATMLAANLLRLVEEPGEEA